MSNADYEIRASGQVFCPVGSLAAAVEPLDTLLPLTGLKTTGPNDRWVGMAAMVGDEIVRVTAINEGNVHVARGCADTVPAAHASGTLIWFLDTHTGNDTREYVDGQTVSIKVLPKTNSGQVPMASSPPQALTFGHRFIRPYPPGDVKCGGVSVFSATNHIDGTASLSLTWANRNRVVQADQLIGHTEANATPEAGQTTRARMYTTAGTLVATHDGLAGTSWTLDRPTLVSDYSLLSVANTGDYAAYLLLDAVRDGYGSYQSYRIDFTVDTNGIAPTQFILLESGDKLLLESGDHLLLEN